MEAYDMLKIDQAMSRRINAIFSDPQRHQFYSCYEHFEGERGPRGGIVRGRKRKCYWCGGEPSEHADTTEAL